MTMKLVNDMSFEEKVSFVVKDLNSFINSSKEMSSFSNSSKEILDVSCFELDPHFIKFFCDELFVFTQKEEVCVGKRQFFRSLQ